MNKTEIIKSIQKLLEQLEQEENNVDELFHQAFGDDHDEWTVKQQNDHERTMKHIWSAGESLASAIHSLED